MEDALYGPDDEHEEEALSERGFERPGKPADELTESAGHAPSDLSVFESGFPGRAAAFLRFSPINEAVRAASHKDWPSGTYDIVTLALAAIDMIVSRQGMEPEATPHEVIGSLHELAYRAAPGRSSEEHRDVAVFVLDFLLNRQDRERGFFYSVSDYTSPDQPHNQRPVGFRLLERREDPRRDQTVLRATSDAINALIGGLDFDVEDAQEATEILLGLQLDRDKFSAAQQSAERARLLSVELAGELDRVIKHTRRDLRMVESEWATTVPERLSSAREHIKERLNSERQLLDKVNGALESAEPKVRSAALRIAVLLDECRQRHEELHKRVMDARGVFLDEQERQSFRPPAAIHLPDLHGQVLLPALRIDRSVAAGFFSQLREHLGGPHPPRLPRLYRILADLWEPTLSLHNDADAAEDQDSVAESPPPLLTPETIDTAFDAVRRTGLPARLSSLIAACYAPHGGSTALQRQAAELLQLAALWAYSPEDGSVDEHVHGDLMSHLLGPRAAADTDDTPLHLPGWVGDDLIVVPNADALADAAPEPCTRFKPAKESSDGADPG